MLLFANVLNRTFGLNRIKTVFMLTIWLQIRTIFTQKCMSKFRFLRTPNIFTQKTQAIPQFHTSHFPMLFLRFMFNPTKI